MKLLVVGGGGREHAIIKKLKENPAVEEIFALPETVELQRMQLVLISQLLTLMV